MDKEPGRILTTRERISYSVFNGADLLIKNLIGKYLFFFYTTTLGVNPLWIAIGQPLVKILDVATDPLVGEWSDRRLNALRKFFRWAKQQEPAVDNPFDILETVFIKQQQDTAPGWLKHKEQLALLRAPPAASRTAPGGLSTASAGHHK